MNFEGQKLADILFPDVSKTPADLLRQFPARPLPTDAAVTRFAPSPTGFAHLGALYTALIAQRIAQQSGGLFFLRIEDTDKEREIENGIQILTDALEHFGLHPDEGVRADGTSFGDYGPYLQSARRDLYRVFAKELVRRGRAYPCFCTPAQLAQQRERQELQKTRTGYYGVWAVHRDASLEDAAERITAGEPFALRLRSGSIANRQPETNDLIKGRLHLQPNDQDAVLLKSDGLPTYHFAHVVDDTLMRVTHVIRGDEWLSSVPLHLELFSAFDLSAPHYAHLAPIMKMDGTSKRKLSKRKDPEADVAFFVRAGYPSDAIREYLLNLANSNFEDWRRANPTEPHTSFILDLAKTNASGALFDIIKLNDISKQVIARMTADELFHAVVAWAEQFEPLFAQRLRENESYSHAIFGIERQAVPARKDIARWEEVFPSVAYFFDEVFAAAPREEFPECVRADAPEIIRAFIASYNAADTRDAWMEKLRAVAEQFNCAPDTKTFKAQPQKFRGHLGDIAGVLRIAVSGRAATPDLFEVMQVLGEKRIAKRLNSG